MNNLNANFNHFNLNSNLNNLNNNANFPNYIQNRNEISNQLNRNGLSNSTTQILLDLSSILDRLQFLASLNNKQQHGTKINQLMVTCKGQITNHLEQSTELRVLDNGDQLITGKF